MAHHTPLYPVTLVVVGRDCLVVGGGPVAARKVRGLLDCGARVTVVAPEVVEAIRSMAPGPGPDDQPVLTVAERPYRRPEAADYRLVVTATGIPEVDHAVASDAEAAGVWVNCADDAGNCSFLLPAVHRQGPVTVAVSTAGASPALAGWLRDRVAEAVGPDVAVLAGLLDEARSHLREAGVSTESFDWPAILDQRVVPLVHRGRIDEARAVLRSLTTP
ncbi:MAG: bifunctional precorrin-2 dehydrogenase/sirohydrochlorin ferrochelatase [Acidimicrobiales bacterium]